MRSFFQYAKEKTCLPRSIKIALLVGTINALITQYDAVFNGTLALTNIFQIVLTYMVPFGVATFSSVMQARQDEMAEISRNQT